jgi:hypothetical protein
MNTEYVKLTEAARKLTTHPDTVRYWVKLLGVETIKRGHSCYLMAETLGVLAVMARLIADGIPAGEAAVRAKAEAPADITALVVRPAEPPSAEMDELKARLQGLERAMLTMAETFKTEVVGLRGEVARLTESNQALQLRLEPPPLPAAFNEPPKPVRAWSPPKLEDPAAEMGFLRRAWVQFTHPEQLRRRPS